MLTWIRKKSSGLLMTFVMGLLILAFAMWGVQDYFTQSSNDAVAVVNGEKISINEYSQQFSQYRQNLMNQFGEGFDPSYFESPMMKRNFLESMINNELFKQAAADSGYVVTASEIRAIIEDAATFKDASGKFSPELYASFLSQTNQSATILQGKITDGLIATAINDAVDLTNFVTPAEQKSIAALNLQTRNFDYVVVSPQPFLESIELSDEDIKTYYDNHHDQYMTEPQVAVDYIELNAETVAADIQISEQEALEDFEKNKVLYQKGEQRLASHILINDSDDAQTKIASLKQLIDEGADFAELAKENSEDPGSAAQGGDLGWVNSGDMVAEFDEALFSMSEGTVSEPVKTSFGYHLIKLHEIKASDGPIFEEVKNDIVQALQAQKAENLFLDKASELAALVLDAEDNLDSVAEDSGFELKTTGLFTRNSGEGLAANADFREAAFSGLVKDDLQNSDVINISDTHIVFIHINESKEAALKPLEEVRESVAAAVKNEQAKAMADELAEKLLTSANDGQTLQQLADENDLTLVVATDVKRTGSEHPFTLVANVFSTELNEGDSTVLLEANGNDVALVKLTQINDADLENVDLNSETAQLSRNVKANEQQLLIKALREKADVYINEDMLSQTGF
ncbi:SurA N-terminal domain-containing protein [Marinicella rhabdoformis]|uniref:SurA N-terminal domain-containing protein n=1 Tax=Marinicella rhabdoformis TaxID=2580566 RepID=UPI0012AEBB57|nr:SurA N-terminal domain-containing protein [Marinicella rhabdoformis]